MVVVVVVVVVVIAAVLLLPLLLLHIPLLSTTSIPIFIPLDRP